MLEAEIDEEFLQQSGVQSTPSSTLTIESASLAMTHFEVEDLPFSSFNLSAALVKSMKELSLAPQAEASTSAIYPHLLIESVLQ